MKILNLFKVLFIVTTIWLVAVTVKTFFLNTPHSHHSDERGHETHSHETHHHEPSKGHKSLDDIVNQDESFSFESLPLSHQSDILIKRGDLSSFKEFIKNNPNIKSSINKFSEVDGRTLLTRASFNGSLEIIKYIVESLGASVNTADKDQITPLMEATGSENMEVFKYLIEKGANIHATNKLGADALTMALGGPNEKMASLLIAKGADVNHTWNKTNFTYLMNASRSGHLKVVELLLNAKALVDERDNYGNTALHYASAEGFKDIVILLKSKGASLSLKNKLDQTPGDLALKNGFSEIEALLK